MDAREAAALIADAVGDRSGTWADIGAGSGTFTRALRRLLPDAQLYAVDRDTDAVRALQRLDAVTAIRADFSVPEQLAALADVALDGLLLANALHFVRDQESVLRNLVSFVRPAGRVVLVEYDQRAASRWVPYPVPKASWPALAEAAGLTGATVTATHPSMYAGELWVGAADRR